MWGCKSRLSSWTFRFFFCCFLWRHYGAGLGILLVSSWRSALKIWKKKGKCKWASGSMKVQHDANVEWLTEYADKDGLVVIILYQVNLRDLFLPWFQLLLNTFHKKFRHCAPAIADEEKQTFEAYILHVISLLLSCHFHYLKQHITSTMLYSSSKISKKPLNWPL